MSIYKQDYFGFVYLWYDRRRHMFYVGSHQGRLDDGYICGSKWMRQAYRKRPNDFKRRILSMLLAYNRELLFAEEKKWLDLIKENELGKRYYNINRVAGGGNTFIGRKHSKETLELISNKIKGKNHYMWGKHHTDETKNLISRNKKEQYRDKNNNPFYGKHHTDESKRKISENEERKRKISKAKSKPVLIIGKPYNSIKEASHILKVEYGAVQYRVNSESPKWKDWFFSGTK